MAEESSGLVNKEGDDKNKERKESVKKEKGKSSKESPGRVMIFQLICAIPLIFVTLFVTRHDLLNFLEMKYGYGTMQNYGLPDGVMKKFNEFDTDLSGCIDPEEFAMMDLVSVREAVSN